MKLSLLVPFGIGIVCIAVAVGAIFYMQRGSHMDLPGKIIKVRTASTDTIDSVVAIDFQITNPSDFPFMVGSVEVLLEEPDGSQHPGMVASEQDAVRLFQGLPLLGQKYNTTPIIREKLASHVTQDRMAAAQFNVPESRLQARKRFVVRLTEIDGKVFDISEK